MPVIFPRLHNGWKDSLLTISGLHPYHPVVPFYPTCLNFDGLVKSPNIVIPANAGIQNILKWLDSGSPDIRPAMSPEWQNRGFPTFYGFINFSGGDSHNHMCLWGGCAQCRYFITLAIFIISPAYDCPLLRNLVIPFSDKLVQKFCDDSLKWENISRKIYTIQTNWALIFDKKGISHGCNYLINNWESCWQKIVLHK